jgi:hypothetical protein
VRLTWTDTTRWETGYRVERQKNGGAWTLVKTAPVSTTRVFDAPLDPNATYLYRVRAEGTTTTSWATSPSITTPDSTAPYSYTETIHCCPNQPNELMTKVSQDSKIIAYRDSGVTAGSVNTWTTYANQVWTYAQKYNKLSGQPLYTLYHDNGGGGTADVYFYNQGDGYHQFIDMQEPHAWTVQDPEYRDLVAHEVSHIIENSAYGVYGTPSAAIWQDSKFAGIFTYAVYDDQGLTTDRDRFKTALLSPNKNDNYPIQGNNWFRDWWLPIYDGDVSGSTYEGTVALDRYFKLLSENFHVYNGQYARSVNWGEFVHFWSGAAGVNLQPLAAVAFGWSAEWTAQLAQAKIDYPGVSYTGI